MKTFEKLLLFIASSLVLVGTVVFVTSLSKNGWNISDMTPNRGEEKVYQISENFTDISIDTDTEDIEIIFSSENKVICYDEEDKVHNVVVEEGKLKIESIDNRKWYDYLFDVSSYKVVIYINQEVNLLNIKESTGDIKIESGFICNELNIETSTSVVKINEANAKKVNISASTGDVVIYSLISEEINVKTSTGNIYLESVQCNGSIGVYVSTGDSFIKNLNCTNFISTGNTGDITLEEVIVSEKVDIKRSTGDVTFNKFDAGEMKIETDTGDVTGTLLSEKIFIVETSTGNKIYPYCTIGGKCYITTSTGDIVITIIK